jgi:hypothetical protein
VRWAEERNILHLKINVRGRRGFPDHFFFIDGGRPALIEFKKPGESPGKLQSYIIGLLAELNYDILVTDNKEEATKWLNKKAQTAQLSAQGGGVAGKSRRGRTVRRSGRGENELHPPCFSRS